MEAENQEQTAAEGAQSEDQEQTAAEGAQSEDQEQTAAEGAQTEDQEQTAAEGAQTENKPRNPSVTNEKDHIKGNGADQIIVENDGPRESEICEMNPKPSEEKVLPERTLWMFVDLGPVEPSPNPSMGLDEENGSYLSMLYAVYLWILMSFAGLRPAAQGGPGSVQGAQCDPVAVEPRPDKEKEKHSSWLYDMYCWILMIFAGLIPALEGPGTVQGGQAQVEPGSSHGASCDPVAVEPSPKKETYSPRQYNLYSWILRMLGGPAQGGPVQEEPGPVNKGQAPKQGQTAQEGSGSAQGGSGPAQGGPAQGEPGPTHGGPALKQGQIAKEGSGFAQRGSGREHGGSGSAQGGSGPVQGGSGPAKGGPGQAQGGSGPTQGGSGPGQSGSGPEHGGSGSAQGGSGPAQEGSGPSQGRSGPAQGGPGPAQGGSGPTQGGSGPGQSGSGPEQGKSGPEQGGSGPGQSGSGPEQGKSGPEQGGSGSAQEGSGPAQGGPGPAQGGSGPTQGGSGPGQSRSGPEQGGSEPAHGGSGPEQGESGPEQGGSVQEHRASGPAQSGPVQGEPGPAHRSPAPKQGQTVQRRPEPAQAGPRPAQEGPGKGGSGPAQRGPVQEEPGPANRGQAPKQGQTAQEGSGFAQRGSGPEHGGSGSAQGGSGPTQGGSGPTQGGPGHAQGGPGSAQGRSGPTQGGSGPAQGGPEKGGPALGEPGPAHGGPALKQGEIAKEGSGFAQRGSGPEHGGSRSAQGGSGPVQGGPEPAQGGSGPTQGGSEPGQIRSGPEQGESGPEQGGPGSAQGGSGQAQEGSGPAQGGPEHAQGGPGPAQGGSGPGQSGSGPEQGESGPEHGGSGSAQGGSGLAQEGSGPSHGGSGPAQGGSLPAQGGPGPAQGGSGPTQGGSGPGQIRSGPEQGESGPEHGGPGSAQGGSGQAQEGSGPAQGGSEPEHRGSGPAQGRPEKGGPAQGEPGPAHGGPALKQGQIAKEGSGFAQRGSGPEHGGSGSAQGGSGPVQGGSGPGQSGSGPEQGESGPEHGLSEPAQSRSRPQQGGSESAQGGSGPEQGGSGPEQGGSVQEHRGSGPAQGGSGPEQGGSVQEHRGSGPAQGGSGPAQGGLDSDTEQLTENKEGLELTSKLSGDNGDITDAGDSTKNSASQHSTVHIKEKEEEIKRGKDNSTDSENCEMKPTPSEAHAPPELTLVIFGDPAAVEPGPNLLLGPEKQNEPFSSMLYDLCGRIVVVYDFLGLKNTEHFPSDKDVTAFLLLLPHGHHVSQYEPSVQWLKSSFGEGALDYLITIVTHESKEQCDGAMADMKDFCSFFAQRFHVCSKSLKDTTEILSLLEKIDVMVSKNGQKSYKRPQKEVPGPQGGSRSAQGRPELEQKGQEKGGPRPERGGSGPKQGGQGPAQGEPGPAQGGPVPAQGGKDEQTKENNRMGVSMKSQQEALLSRLNLQNRLKHKLTSEKFLQIHPTLKHDQHNCESDLISVYLHKLLMLDHRARYVEAKQEISDENQFKQQHDNEEEDDDVFFTKNVDSVAESQQSNIHPLDLQMAVLHCSDDFLKQKIVTKLSQCQYALPLLVPDPFTEDIECPLWTFREIKKTWKKTETKDNLKVVIMKSMPICKAETPMVFCFRLGSLSVSKSQLINTLINDRHSTFFHRNCPGSTKSRLLFDGVVEIAWYCPAGRSSDTFTDCVAFCNLHGDGLIYDKQLKIMMDMASVNVVFVPTLEKDPVISALLKSPVPLIVLVEDDAEGAKQMKKDKYRVGIKERSLSDVSKELKKIIKTSLRSLSDTVSCTDFYFQLELSSRAMIPVIRVDENNISCQRGLSAAGDLTRTIETTEVSRIKEIFLPCQGELWRKWGQLNKEQYRLKGEPEKKKGEKQTEMRRLRENQCKTVCSKLVTSFVKHLSSLPKIEGEYFLKWTQILMDAHATDCLSSILQSYDQVWSEVLDLKKKPDKSNDLKSKQKELAEVSQNLQSATCGLEHIFREMCQIYEAHTSLKKQPKNEQTDWSKYPELAAELMISGHPMELMDGDAGQVPITWISSLIDQVILKLGNKRVFVLSVLGIQSSGKSTMLNAMFGLQFAVSAGRCTRGAFMQLVKLSDEIMKDFQWDYILVVDTEGLRALELEGNATIHHDNELATFVVGVGNMTLVNIFGENPSEIQDVLQIVVQAFMRMKKVSLSPSVVFVHQNVTDVGAAEKNMDGKRKLQEKLDQMVQLAAKEEVCNAESFSNIIEFDVQKDVKYFAQLWEGSPPMAPPNPGYSESVQELRSFILSKAAKSSGIKLSEFKTKVKDLWNALLNENFVFSFRNTLEIAVYRKLEKQYGNWTWSLRQEMLRIEEKLYTRIENGSLNQVELNYLHGEISKKYIEVTNDFKKYFDDDKEDMLVQWRGSFEIKIQDFCDELVGGLLKKLTDVMEQKKAGKRLDEKKPMFENTLLQKSKELAHQLKDKAKDEDELKKQFNRVWEDWVTELIQGTKPIENVIITNDVISVLLHHGFEQSLIHDSQTSKAYKDLLTHGHYSSYESQRCQKQKVEKDQWKNPVSKLVTNFVKTMINVFVPLSPKEQNQIQVHIQTIEKEALELIKSKPVATRGYNSTYLCEVAAHVITRVADLESNWKHSFKKEFTVDLILYVFDSAERWISQSHAQYIKNTDAHTYLESKRDEYYTVFRSFCRGSSSAVVLAEVICEKLKSSMTEFVRTRTAIDIAGHMRENHPAFNENRLNLEKHVLKSLADEEDFESYITYIYEPKRHIETFIQEKVHKYIMKEKNVPLIQKNVAAIETFVMKALYQATEKVQEGDVKIWLQEFDNLIKEKLTTVSVSSKNFSDVNKFDFLKDAIEKGLVPIIDKLKNLPLTEIRKARMQPDQMLIDQLCNCCWETCPFCKAVCTNTVKDHSPTKHCVPYHRPSGVKGWHKKVSGDLVIDFCTTSVASDNTFRPDYSEDKYFPYKQYQTAGGKYAEWQITPNGSMLIYWKWFVCHFQNKLEDHHKRKFQGSGEIPSEWRNFSKEEAIESLEEMYNM